MNKFKKIAYWVVGLAAVVGATFNFDSVRNIACKVNSVLNLEIEECQAKADTDVVE